MKQTKMTITLCMMFSIILSTSGQTKDFLSTCKKVATQKGQLIVCDQSLLKETITIPLSALTEEMQIIKLDDADEALVKEGYTEISDNYILVKGERQIPYKLFDRKTGKFITTIGSFGQGPGEYQNVYDQQLDEKNNRIYLLPWQTNKILVYDLKGNYLNAIPLCFDVPKGKFKVDTKAGTAIISTLPFDGVKAVIWEQNIKGELLKSIAPGHLSIKRDFSNEMSAFKYGNDYSFMVFTFQPRKDTLYHYNSSQNKLLPAFTLDFKTTEIPIHSYQESFKFFMGDFSEPKQESEYITTTQNHRFYFVDKKTLKGAYFKMTNDFLGDMEIGWPSYAFSNEYYVRNMDPGTFKDELTKILNENKKMDTTMRAKLTKLKEGITDNDNNYILYAKIKK